MDMSIVMKCLLEDNMSYSEIAKKLNVSRQAVHQAVHRYRNKKFNQVKDTSCIYHGLRNWMNQNKIKVSNLLKMCANHGKKERTVYFNLRGANEMTKSTIDVILKVTGLTYEQAFGNEGNTNEDLL